MALKRGWKICTRIIEALAVLLVLAYAALNNPRVQSLIARKLNIEIGKDGLVGGHITMGRMRIIPLSTIIIDDFLITDESTPYVDTLLYIRHLSAKMTPGWIGDLRRSEAPTVARAKVDGALFNIACFDGTSNLSAVFMAPPPGDTLVEVGDLFKIRRLDLKNSRVTCRNMDDNPDYVWSGIGINWMDIDARVIDSHFRDFNYMDSRVSFHLITADISEKSGYEASLSGDCITGMGLVEISDTRLKDRWSDIDLRRYTMAYDNLLDWSEYIDKIRMELDLGPTTLSFRSLKYFTGALPDCPASLKIHQGCAYGTRNDLHISIIDARETHSGVDVKAGGVLQNVFDPLTDNTVGAEVDRIDFTMSSLGKLISAFSPSFHSESISRFAPGVGISYSGHVNGWIDRLDTDGIFNTDCGEIFINAITTRPDDAERDALAFLFEGELSFDELDLGRMASVPNLKETSLRLKASAEFRDDHISTISLDTIQVNMLHYIDTSDVEKKVDYSFRKINGKGRYDSRAQVFNGKIISEDENLRFDFLGKMKFGGKGSSLLKDIKGVINIDNLDLEAIGFDQRGGGSRIKGSLNFQGIPGETTIFANSINYYTRPDSVEVKHRIGSFKVTCQDTDESTGINIINSEFFREASLKISVPLDSLSSFLSAAFVDRFLMPQDNPIWKNNTLSLKLISADTGNLLSVLKSDIYIAPETKIYITQQNDGKFVKSQIACDSLNISGTAVRDVALELKAQDRTLSIVKVKDITHYESPGLTGQISNLKITADAGRIDITANALGEEQGTSLDLFAKADILKADKDSLLMKFSLSGTELRAVGNKWSADDSFVTLSRSPHRTFVDVNRLSFSEKIEKNGYIKANGRINLSSGPHDTRIDTLNVDVTDFDLGLVSKLGLSDRLEGKLNVSGALHTPLNLSDSHFSISTSPVRLRSTNLGHMDLKVDLNGEDQRAYISGKHFSPSGVADISLNQDHGSFVGWEEGQSGTRTRIGVLAHIKNLDISCLQTFVGQNLIKGLAGQVDNKLRAEIILENGREPKYNFNGTDLSVSGVGLTLVPTGVKYSVGGHIGGKGHSAIVGLDIADNSSGSARLSGNLSDTLRLEMNSLRVLGENAELQEAKGNLRLSGYVEEYGLSDGNMTVSAHINTLPGTLTITLPKASAESSNGHSFKMAARARKAARKKTGKFAVITKDCVLSLDDRTRLRVNLDENASNNIEINGKGAIGVNYDSRKKDFSLNGNYDITSGQYHFRPSDVFANLEKTFEIGSDSYVKFAGGLKETILNIDAGIDIDHVDIGALISDTTSVSGTRTVKCGISVTNTLSNPQLDFKVDVGQEDLDVITRSLVESELNTPDKVEKQFISLITLGSFAPGSGINNVNSTNLILSNLSSIASGQINNLMRSAKIPVGIGLHYMQNEAGKDIFDVNLASRMFGNRVVVSGKVGNRKYSTTSNDGLVGDIDVEIKMNRAGSLRTKLFSHSADKFTYYLDDSQRSGAGISFQKEFDNLKDLFGSIFRKDKQPEGETIFKSTIITDESR